MRFSLLGMAAVLSLLVALFVPQIAFTDPEGLSYSMRAHFVSELGWFGISEWAWVFSLGLIVGGLCMVGFAIGVGRALGGCLPKIAMSLSVISAFGCVLVGLLPVNVGMVPHLLAAVVYFAGTWWSIAVLTVAILMDPKKRIPRAFAVLGGVVLLLHGGWLFVNPKTELFDHFDWETVRIVNRPKVWLPAIVEWATVLGVLVYILALSLYFRFWGRGGNDKVDG